MTPVLIFSIVTISPAYSAVALDLDLVPDREAGLAGTCLEIDRGQIGTLVRVV